MPYHTNPFIAAAGLPEPKTYPVGAEQNRYNSFLSEGGDAVSCPICFATTMNPAMSSIAFVGEIATCSACGFDGPILPSGPSIGNQTREVIKPIWLGLNSLAAADDGLITRLAFDSYPMECHPNCTSRAYANELYFYRTYPMGAYQPMTCPHHEEDGRKLNRRKRELWDDIMRGERTLPI